MCKINCDCLGCNRPDKEVPKAHKHAAVIKAWADGAEIQYQYNGKWYDAENMQLSWNEGAAYRIKPIPKPLGQVAKDAWFKKDAWYSPQDKRHQVDLDRWTAAAEAAIAAYKEQECK